MSWHSKTSIIVAHDAETVEILHSLFKVKNIMGYDL
jgi:hypothetical protein